MVSFSNGKTHHFDAIIFATGYRSTIWQWLEVLKSIYIIWNVSIIFVQKHKKWRSFYWIESSNVVSVCQTDDPGLIGDDGMPKSNYPDHWKRRNNLYCAGFGWRGLSGSSEEALFIANDISTQDPLFQSL